MASTRMEGFERNTAIKTPLRIWTNSQRNEWLCSGMVWACCIWEEYRVSSQPTFAKEEPTMTPPSTIVVRQKEGLTGCDVCCPSNLSYHSAGLANAISVWPRWYIKCKTYNRLGMHPSVKTRSHQTKITSVKIKIDAITSTQLAIKYY
jgi:hypothetical protein